METGEGVPVAKKWLSFCESKPSPLMFRADAQVRMPLWWFQKGRRPSSSKRTYLSKCGNIGAESTKCCNGRAWMRSKGCPSARCHTAGSKRNIASACGRTPSARRSMISLNRLNACRAVQPL